MSEDAKLTIYETDMFRVVVDRTKGCYAVVNNEHEIVEFETSVLVQACLTADQLETDTSKFFRDKKTDEIIAKAS